MSGSDGSSCTWPSSMSCHFLSSCRDLRACACSAFWCSLARPLVNDDTSCGIHWATGGTWGCSMTRRHSALVMAGSCSSSSEWSRCLASVEHQMERWCGRTTSPPSSSAKIRGTSRTTTSLMSKPQPPPWAVLSLASAPDRSSSANSLVSLGGLSRVVVIGRSSSRRPRGLGSPPEAHPVPLSLATPPLRLADGLMCTIESSEVFRSVAVSVCWERTSSPPS
mmetsp:Transcript_31102/g.90310  ORF Transcript_31102/g.90310 Transcript_31102/m.90310 type:complete len:222 (-) Transcript_31102:776-1441(-)